MWKNENVKNIDHLLPAGIEREPLLLELPLTYVWAVSTMLALWLSGIPRLPDDVPTCHASE